MALYPSSTVPAAASNAETLLRFVGRPVDPVSLEQARNALDVAAGLARSYTRDKGWDASSGVVSAGGPTNPDLERVILSAAARLMANPGGVEIEANGQKLAGGFAGWTLAELSVLNRWRKRATA